MGEVPRAFKTHAGDLITAKPRGGHRESVQCLIILGATRRELDSDECVTAVSCYYVRSLRIAFLDVRTTGSTKNWNKNHGLIFSRYVIIELPRPRANFGQPCASFTYRYLE